MMIANRATALTACLLPLLSGCASNDGLRREIATIESRIAAVEADVSAGTQQIGQPGKDIRAELAYRPLQSWAANFSARPSDDRSIRFRQTDRGGNLYEVDHKCRWDFQRAGSRARIHEADSTKLKLELGQLAVTPKPDGLDMRTRLELEGRTQAYGWYRPPCIGASVDGNIGVPFSAHTTAVMGVSVTTGSDGNPRYRLALTAPEKIGLELRADFGWFRIGKTIYLANITRELAAGDLNLLYAKQIEVTMPDGTIRAYKISNVDPAVSTNLRGFGFATDLKLEPVTPGS